MFKFIIFILLLSFNLFSSTEIDQLINKYNDIKTVSCKIRRVRNSNKQKIRYLSQVYFSSDNRLHVDNISPVKRTIIADGNNFYSYIKGSENGFSKPIKDLNSEMLISLQKVPGTPMDILLRLTNSEVSVKENKSFNTIYEISQNNKPINIIFNENNLIEKIIFYNDNSKSQVIAEYLYDKYEEVIEGVYIPFKHSSIISINGVSVTESVFVDQYQVNIPLAESLFIKENFFTDDIDFLSKI